MAIQAENSGWHLLHPEISKNCCKGNGVGPDKTCAGAILLEGHGRLNLSFRGANTTVGTIAQEAHTLLTSAVTRFWRCTAPETAGLGGPCLMPRCFSSVRYGKSVTRGVLTAIPGAVPPPVLLMTLSIPPFTVRLTVTR
jgi:hypothetical protein